MPGGDGTGPFGRGPGTGRGMGRGGGRGRGRGQGFGRGKMGGSRPGSGPEGNCVCPECGAKAPHQAGVPCYSIACSNCGAKMIKE